MPIPKERRYYKLAPFIPPTEVPGVDPCDRAVASFCVPKGDLPATTHAFSYKNTTEKSVTFKVSVTQGAGAIVSEQLYNVGSFGSNEIMFSNTKLLRFPTSLPEASRPVVVIGRTVMRFVLLSKDGDGEKISCEVEALIATDQLVTASGERIGLWIGTDDERFSLRGEDGNELFAKLEWGDYHPIKP